MDVIYDLINFRGKEGAFVTVGTFDGIHLGHQEIINTLIKKSKISGKKNVLVTFYPHPQMVVNSKYNTEIKLLTTPEEKLRILEQFRLDQIVFIHFTKVFSKTPPEKFIQNILIEKLHACGIVVGYDHAFGKSRKGRIDFLKKIAKEKNLDIIEVGPFVVNEEKVSSTLIRKLLISGNVKETSKYLGTHYSISGEVIRGEGRGKQFGFPTANLFVKNPEKLIPGNGVYIVRVSFENNLYNGMLYIGTRSTFGESRRTIEVNIFDFNEDIYGEILEVSFIEKIRDDLFFASEKQLYEQIEKDKEESIRYLNNKLII